MKQAVVVAKYRKVIKALAQYYQALFCYLAPLKNQSDLFIASCSQEKRQYYTLTLLTSKL